MARNVSRMREIRDPSWYWRELTRPTTPASKPLHPAETTGKWKLAPSSQQADDTITVAAMKIATAMHWTDRGINALRGDVIEA
jgi:hypothetical protein